MYPQDADSAEILLQHADATMYHAKRTRPSEYRFFSGTVNEQMQRRGMLEAALRGALAAGEVSVVYQPKVRLADGAIVGLEALLRWHSAKFGAVSPAEFIPIAEEGVLIHELGEWVLARSCQTLAACRELGRKDLHVAVNVAPQQLLSAGFADKAAVVREAAGLASGLVQLELTERGMLREPGLVAQALESLRAAGFSIAIDDFGTGYSSLARLRDFPVELLKVDRSFVSTLPDDADNMAIVKATIEFGRQLGIAVCAEGVEAREQAEVLKGLGCHYAQGWYFGRPLAAEDLLELLSAHQDGDGAEPAVRRGQK